MRVGFFGGKFLPLHNGHIYAINIAASLVDTLYVILSSSEKRDRELCDEDGIKYPSAEIRLSWLGETFKDSENIKIIHLEDNFNNYNLDAWKEGSEIVKEKIGKHIDVIFSSEESYTDIFKVCYPTSEHYIIDSNRLDIPISATEIRNNVYKNWKYMPNHVRSYFVKKIAIIGTESCGKSTLALLLANKFNTNYVQEVGRNYCERYDNQLTIDMFDDIAMEHYLLQKEKILNSNKVLFVDSEAVITEYYLHHYYNKPRSQIILEITNKQDFDLYIYLEPTNIWEDDGLRFLGDSKVREQCNTQLKSMFDSHGISYITIGEQDYIKRFNTAVELVNKLLT